MDDEDFSDVSALCGSALLEKMSKKWLRVFATVHGM